MKIHEPNNHRKGSIQHFWKHMTSACIEFLKGMKKLYVVLSTGLYALGIKLRIFKHRKKPIFNIEYTPTKEDDAD